MGKFNPAKYDPATDSSPGSDKFRNGSREGNVILIVDEGTCPSGNCKPVSPKKTYSQGGDARLKGLLQRAAATGTKVTVIAKGKEVSTGTAASMAKTYGFDRHVKAFQDRLRAQEADAARRAADLEERRAKARAESAERAKVRERAQKAKASAKKAKAAARKEPARKATPSRRRPPTKSATEAIAEGNAAAAAS